MEKIDLSERQEKLPIGVNCIDEVMSGGLEPEVITEIYGEGGSGKSNLCMQFAISSIRSGKKVIFLDTEGFSAERFSQVSGRDIEMLNEMMMFRISSLEDQELTLLRLSKMIEKTRPVGLLIIDSFTEFFRLEPFPDASSRALAFQREVSSLTSILLKFKIPILITNQIYQDPSSGELHPFGGYVIDHAVKAIYSIEKLPEGKRRISVVKHRAIREGNFAEFRITDYGISCEG
ncbi:MAG: DNA repair and recombination protein RadB [Thermoplasmatales archaeon]|nr:DNA repair and recombination protein RadB [Thermoplasmatales archaeon]MCW6170195.1 DNA repair and recombination protein RadB [Thermoplasmatales archaeon]